MVHRDFFFLKGANMKVRLSFLHSGKLNFYLLCLTCLQTKVFIFSLSPLLGSERAGQSDSLHPTDRIVLLLAKMKPPHFCDQGQAQKLRGHWLSGSCEHRVGPREAEPP